MAHFSARSTTASGTTITVKPYAAIMWLPAIAAVLFLAGLGVDALRSRAPRRIAVESPIATPSPVPSITAPARRTSPTPVKKAAPAAGPPAMVARAPAPVVRRSELSSKADYERLDAAGLQEAWAREDKDPEWSSNVRASMEVFLQTAAVDPATLKTADCRASLCRLELDFSSPESLPRVAGVMSESGRKLRSSWLPRPDGGPRVAVVYMPREDLPE